MNSNSDPLAILPEAFRAVTRNPRALLLYVGIAAGVVSLKLGATQVLTGGEIPDDPALPLRLFELGSDLIIAGTWAFAQAVAFSWVGQDIDRPLWRIKGIKDALVRFFPLWLMLDLLIIVFSNVAGRQLQADINSSLGHVMLLLFMTMQVIAIPIGGAIMFHGGLKWSELGNSLAPLGRQALGTLFVVMFSGCVLVLILFVLLPGTENAPWLRPLIEIPGGLADCVIFAATFRICIMDRESEDTGDDFDF